MKRNRLPRRVMDADTLALVTLCRCGHQHTIHTETGCDACACRSYIPDDHFYTLGFLAGVS